jgi:3-hydroxybutyryl-CoA dehydrogenase
MKEKIQKVAVVGTGSLGTQIAALASCFGCQVSAYDNDTDSMNSALESLRTIIKTSRRRPFLSLEDWEKGARQVKFCKELEEALRDSDLVVEAVPENLELKRKVFKTLDALAPRQAILATNSSSIPISRLETATAKPRQCLNLHFYNPARGVNMVDIMGGTRTTAETIAAGYAWVRSIGCVPLTVKKEILGFCFNRIWRTVKREALHMWAEGFVDLKDIDRAWMIFTGMSQGPFGLMDNVGLDVVYDIETVYYNESKDAGDSPPDALKAMVEQKLLGTKTGKGFYTYPNPEYSRPDFLNG